MFCICFSNWYAEWQGLIKPNLGHVLHQEYSHHDLPTLTEIIPCGRAPRACKTRSAHLKGVNLDGWHDGARKWPEKMDDVLPNVHFLESLLIWLGRIPNKAKPSWIPTRWICHLSYTTLTGEGRWSSQGETPQGLSPNKSEWMCASISINK